MNISRRQQGNPVWQKSYHDRIIRNLNEFHQIENYIRNNPVNWREDDHNPYFVMTKAA